MGGPPSKQSLRPTWLRSAGDAGSQARQAASAQDKVVPFLGMATIAIGLSAPEALVSPVSAPPDLHSFLAVQCDLKNCLPSKMRLSCPHLPTSPPAHDGISSRSRADSTPLLTHTPARVIITARNPVPSLSASVQI